MSQRKDTSFLLSITKGRVQCKCLSSQKLLKLSEWICEKLADGRWKVGESVWVVTVNLLVCDRAIGAPFSVQCPRHSLLVSPHKPTTQRNVKYIYDMSSTSLCPPPPHICTGNLEQSMGARNRVGIELSYWPAMLHRQAESIPWNWFPVLEFFNNQRG